MASVDIIKLKWRLKTQKRLHFEPFRVIFTILGIFAAYQRAMTAIFHDMIHHSVEVYVDDLVAKSKYKTEHLRESKGCSKDAESSTCE